MDGMDSAKLLVYRNAAQFHTKHAIFVLLMVFLPRKTSSGS
jgi:hypothetical protein